MVAQVVMRYGFGFTPFLTEEIGRYALVWSVLAGSAIAVRHGNHIRVAFIADLLPPRARRAWSLFLHLVTLVLFAVLVVTGIDATSFAHGQASIGMQIPLSYPYAAIPIFFAVSLVFGVARLRRPEGAP